MAIKFERVQPGDVLWNVQRVHGLARLWKIQVLEIDYEQGKASCSWNGNRPTMYTRRQIERCRRSRPKGF